MSCEITISLLMPFWGWWLIEGLTGIAGFHLNTTIMKRFALLSAEAVEDYGEEH